MALSKFQKDPDATLDYTFNWAAWLTGGDTISASSWIVPTGITATSPTHTGTTASALLSGGTTGQQYTCVNRITTVNGLIDDRSLLLSIVDK